ncbi:MAG: formylglycine-generating enzyme family protein [Prevotellaceae bacterium]|nr:formylglycine-generating enzyme family protein [Prevotellaceae bacterium]
MDAVAWHAGNSSGSTHPVGQKQPNELGIYDMRGNVWEWCSDWFDIYPHTPSHTYRNPQGPSSGK